MKIAPFLALLAISSSPLPLHAEGVQSSYVRSIELTRREHQAKQDARFKVWQSSAKRSQNSLCQHLCQDTVKPFPTQPANPFADLPDWAVETDPEFTYADGKALLLEDAFPDGVPVPTVKTKRKPKIAFAGSK